MPLVTNLQSFVTRVGTEFKTVYSRIGTLTSLTTTDKTSIVAAINEVRQGQAQAGAQINDTAAGIGTVYSSSKTEDRITAAVTSLVNAAPAALDTLKELSDALGGDANFAATVNTALANRVRYDAAQTLTGPQQVQARANIGAGTSNLVVGTAATDAKAGNYQPTAANISDATATGRSLLTAIDGATARGLLGAGTSNLVIGTTSTTAKAGDYAPPAASTTVAGLVQLAGMLGGTSTSPTVRTGSETQTGVLELATAAETTTGTSNALAVHPAGLKVELDKKANTADVGATETDFVAAFNTAIA